MPYVTQAILKCRSQMARISKNLYKQNYTDEDLSKALEAIKNGMTKKKAAKTFKIPRTTLIDHASGRKELGKKAGKPSCIPKAVEEEIVRKVLRAAEEGFPCTKMMLLSKVGRFVRTAGLPTPFTNGMID